MGVGMITIRPFRASDVEPAAALEAAHRPQPWSAQVFQDELDAPNRTYLTAVDDGLVGFGGVMLVGEEAHITNLLVDPARRREGIGRSLLISLIHSAIDQGARHLTLEVRSRNREARSLYASLGLAPVGVRRGYYRDDDALVMWVHDIDSPQYAERLA